MEPIRPDEVAEKTANGVAGAENPAPPTVAALQEEFDRLMQRVREGCPDAAQEVFNRFSEPIRWVVRRKLNRRLRTQYDSVDFIQSVWASFFQVPAERFTFASPQELIGFLAQLATHKVVDAFRRRLQTAKHDLKRECSYDALADNNSPELPFHQATPSQVAIAHEHWERMVDGLPPMQRRILEMLRQGHSHAEIAAQLGLHNKVIRRFLEKMTSKVDRA
jgi:RNA polymerase sigma-70 factor (ECF subfamily)